MNKSKSETTMALNHRNQTIARVAYAVAQSDGAVQKIERDTLQTYLEAHHDVFSEDDQADILSYFDDFAFQLGTAVLDDWRMKSLGVYLYTHDASPMLDLLDKIAEAYDGIVPQEAALIGRIREHLSKSKQPES
jgi:tellurite resistance protein